MDPRFTHIDTLFFDADDTLWENDIFYRRAEAEFAEYITGYMKCADADRVARETLSDKQEENIPVFGYGSKTYLLGMLDAAAVLAPDQFGPDMYRDIKQIIIRLSTHPFIWLDGALETVRLLSRRYRIIIATKGELTEQMRKYRSSGLEDCVTAIEVMERKSEQDYRNLAIKMGIEPENFFMVGNAVRSDIAPVIAMGGWAVHIPYAITWAHEIMDIPDSPRVLELTSLSQLQNILL